MKKTTVIGILFVCFVMMNFQSFANIIKSEPEEEPIILNPTITVRGGWGIVIFVYGVEDDTKIAANVEDAFLMNSVTQEYLGNKMKLHLNILDGFIIDDFKLNIFVDEQLWSYKCHSLLFVFVIGIEPLE